MLLGHGIVIVLGRAVKSVQRRLKNVLQTNSKNVVKFQITMLIVCVESKLTCKMCRRRFTLQVAREIVLIRER